ncbi:MAG: hypothetical protein Q8O22_06740 [Candidatus Omnitrophota bacterium]|nr:hypothetical protein [Candidatus Omnitrophota bacterium]
MRGKNLLILCAGAALGAGLFFSSGVALLLIAFSAFILYIKRRHNKQAAVIFLIAVILRVTLCILHVSIGYALSKGSDTAGDAVGYSGGAAYIAELTTNTKIEKYLIADELANLRRFRSTYKGALPKYDDWRVDGYTYYLGLVYALFGYSPVTVKLINSLLFIISVYIIYRYLLDNFGQKTAFIFLPLALFIPSMFFWSISGVKDQMIVFFFISGIFSLLYLVKAIKNRKSFFIICGYAPLIFLSAAGIRLFRPAALPVFYLMTGLVGSLYVFVSLQAYHKLIKVGIFLSVTCLLATPAARDLSCRVYKRFTYASIAKSMVYQYDAVTRYQIYPERYNYDEKMKKIGITKFNPPSVKEFAVMTLTGFYHVFFSPVAWFSRSKTELLASPEGHFMLITFFWAACGIFFCFRNLKLFTLALPIIVPFFVLLAMLTYFEGNVGTLVRHKSVLLPFYCAILAIGIGGAAVNRE